MNLWEVVSYHNLFDSLSLCSHANLEIHFLAQQDRQHPMVPLETFLVESEAVFLLEDKQEATQMVVHNDHNLLDLDEIWSMKKAV
jgi:hypothetical protein